MKPARNHLLVFWLALFAAVGSLPLTIVLAQSGGGYHLEWNTCDAGGHTFSSGGGYTLGGTVGQPDAGTLSGGAYALNGGFWNGLASPQAITRYAAPTAQGSGDCSSWANACTLQTALANAGNGDEIWVKMGVHYPGAAGNRTATFTLKNGMAVYGGFAGTETSRDERNWRANPTILSGDIDGNDNHGGDYINENASQIVGSNAYHVVTGSGTNSTAVLDGFIITAGQANLDYTGFPNDSGGGMYNNGGSPTLVNIIFSGNYASYGGALRNYNGSNPAFTNVIFRGNSAIIGGALFNHNSSPTFKNVTFNGNAASDRGGGLYNSDSSPTLTNVTFYGNSAINGGGMYNYSSSPTLTNAILWSNGATYGPEIYNNNSTPSISYSDIQGCGGSGNWNTACGTDNGNNIDADPLFVDAYGADHTAGTADDNPRLSFGSPAIESGTNSGCPATDLDGLPRPADGNGDSTAACDMGAFEAGTMLCSVAANTAYTFDKDSNVVITTTATLGNLTCLYVDEMVLNHPNATVGIQTGRYWLIRGLQSDKQTNATGFSVNLTLPTGFTPDANDKVCRYTGSGQIWDCAMSSFTANSITRNGVSAFSDWAAGNDVGPTAVTLAFFTARSALPPVVLLMVGAALLFLTGWRVQRRDKRLSGNRHTA